jgi:2-iminoacetate synthase
MNNDFFNLKDINNILSSAKNNISDAVIQKVLSKIDGKTDSYSDTDTAILLYAPPKFHQIIFDKAKGVNNRIYGKQRFFYGVIYVSDFCIETCTYCGDNIRSERGYTHTLSPKQFNIDVSNLLQLNPNLKELCFLSGNNLWSALKWSEYLSIVFKKYSNELTLNVNPFTLDEFKEIRQHFPDKKLQFRVFQETYDESIYDKLQPDYESIKDEIPPVNRAFLKRKGIVIPSKKDFYYRLNSQERAIEAGFDNYGLGVLLGLNNGIHKSFFEVLAMKKHSEYMFQKYSKWPKTISFPRIRNSVGINYKIPAEVNDYDMERIISVMRIVIPNSHLVMTCREAALFRTKIRPIINIEDFAARPGPGGNSINNVIYQMEIEDSRTGEEIKNNILEEGYFIE